MIITGVIIIPVLVSPMPRFRAPLSTVVEARDGSLLGARIADDGQWRFPSPEQVPEKFKKALLTFEDRYFFYHPGINPAALVRAFRYNMKAREIVSGGSTITMQVARLSRPGRQRSYGEKLVEMLQALKMEIFRSKKDILTSIAQMHPSEETSWDLRQLHGDIRVNHLPTLHGQKPQRLLFSRIHPHLSIPEKTRSHL